MKYTREGAHSCPRILFHKDITGKEITSKLLERVKERKNVTIFEYTTMTDILEEDGKCIGILAENEQGTLRIHAADTILASGGIGGTYQHSTNFPHLTGDAIRIAKTRSAVGTSGLCADPSDDIVFEKTRKTLSDLGVSERGRGSAVQ